MRYTRDNSYQKCIQFKYKKSYFKYETIYEIM